MRINGESVSRFHSILRFESNGFFLEDANSKFGTLVEIKEPLKIKPFLPYCIQVGRTVLTILAKIPHRIIKRYSCRGEPIMDEQEIKERYQMQASGLLDITLDEVNINLLKSKHNL